MKTRRPAIISNNWRYFLQNKILPNDGRSCISTHMDPFRPRCVRVAQIIKKCLAESLLLKSYFQLQTPNMSRIRFLGTKTKLKGLFRLCAFSGKSRGQDRFIPRTKSELGSTQNNGETQVLASRVKILMWVFSFPRRRLKEKPAAIRRPLSEIFTCRRGGKSCGTVQSASTLASH